MGPSSRQSAFEGTTRCRTGISNSCFGRFTMAAAYRSWHGAWQDEAHAQVFGRWSQLSDRGLRKTFEQYPEMKFFLRAKTSLQEKSLFEVGCATGEFYRYFSAFHAEFSYAGNDISSEAVAAATQRYPGAKFYLTDTEQPLSAVIAALGFRPALLFVRDVIHHQPDPFAFLRDALTIPTELAILKIRTRDWGDTVLDPERSCQYQYGQWVPYFVLNASEVIATIRETIPCTRIVLLKDYQPLGGHNDRYLPKDCYEPATGTALTVVGVWRAQMGSPNPEIIIEEDRHVNPRLTIFDRKPSYIFKKVISKVLRPNR